LITDKEVQIIFDKFFNNSVAKAEILLDLANDSTGIAYVVFLSEEDKNKCIELQLKQNYIFLRYIYLVSPLFSRNNFLFLFFSSRIWNGPILIQPYFDEKIFIEEEEQEQEEKFFRKLISIFF
jgi:hypothetical protein